MDQAVIDDACQRILQLSQASTAFDKMLDLNVGSFKKAARLFEVGLIQPPKELTPENFDLILELYAFQWANVYHGGDGDEDGGFVHKADKIEYIVKICLKELEKKGIHVTNFFKTLDDPRLPEYLEGLVSEGNIEFITRAVNAEKDRPC